MSEFFEKILRAIARPLTPVYPGLIASAIKDLLNLHGAHADQHQANGVWAVHQVRVRLNGDDTVYRVLVAPADAPIFIGRQPVEGHFLDPIAVAPAGVHSHDAPESAPDTDNLFDSTAPAALQDLASHPPRSRRSRP